MNLDHLMAPDWAEAMAPVANELASIGRFLDDEVAAGRDFLPHRNALLKAFARPMADVRVLIIGQDPYPTPGHAVGLSFSVAPDICPLPRSLTNIFTELQSDVDAPPPATGDLTSWADQGVMLLNRVLTVRPGVADSHRRHGWEAVTECAIAALAACRQPLVAILWGRQAQALAPLLGDIPTIESPHPSPLSASRGFFGSRPFSRANALLIKQGAQPIEWSLPG